VRKYFYFFGLLYLNWEKAAYKLQSAFNRHRCVSGGSSGKIPKYSGWQKIEGQSTKLRNGQNYTERKNGPLDPYFAWSPGQTDPASIWNLTRLTDCEFDPAQVGLTSARVCAQCIVACLESMIGPNSNTRHTYCSLHYVSKIPLIFSQIKKKLMKNVKH
jgi:hypothetical protein